MIQYRNKLSKLNCSDYISQKNAFKLQLIICRIFKVYRHFNSAVYYSLKIERVRELLLSNKMNLSEITYQLNYSSVSHLSKQFKMVTGICPSSLIKHGHSNKKKCSSQFSRSIRLPYIIFLVIFYLRRINTVSLIIIHK